MRVLVTRPEPAANATAEKLRARGYQPVLLPLSRAVHDRDAAFRALTSPFDALVVTSAEVFRVRADVPNTVKSLRIFCVGPATAEAARHAGFTDIVTAEGTGLSLAARIANDPSRPALLYLAGEPRSPDLEASLTEAGLLLTVAVCYRMEPVTPEAGQIDAAFAPPPQAILFYSRESALRFFRLPDLANRRQTFARAQFLCISTRTASAVPPEYAAQIAVAATPDETALLSLLPLPSSQN